MNINCPKCHTTDPNLFAKNRKRPNGLQVYCKLCTAEYRADWFAKDPERLRRKSVAHRVWNWRNKGIDVTEEQYDAMLLQQNQCCALCFKPFDENQPPAVDHDHVTGKVRALLHTKCNLAIGLLGDDPATVQLAVEYLERHLQNA